jgi:hypothetical protein
MTEAMENKGFRAPASQQVFLLLSVISIWPREWNELYLVRTTYVTVSKPQLGTDFSSIRQLDIFQNFY